MPGPINTPRQTIVIEYDGKDGRLSKTFNGLRAEFAARRFYVDKLNRGKNPTVRKAKP